MESIFRIAAASLTLAVLAAVSTPVLAGPARLELRFGNGYDQQQAYVQPGVMYESRAPVNRYQDENGWRQQQWRERERREHYWQEQRGREHEGHEEHHDRDYHGDWR